jgi:hypothetical protein
MSLNCKPHATDESHAGSSVIVPLAPALAVWGHFLALGTGNDFNCFEIATLHRACTDL